MLQPCADGTHRIRGRAVGCAERQPISSGENEYFFPQNRHSASIGCPSAFISSISARGRPRSADRYRSREQLQTYPHSNLSNRSNGIPSNTRATISSPLTPSFISYDRDSMEAMFRSSAGTIPSSAPGRSCTRYPPAAMQRFSVSARTPSAQTVGVCSLAAK